MNYDPKKYWQERGKDYSVSADTSDELDHLTRLVKLHSRKINNILEVGSGYGRVYQHLVRNSIPRHYFTLCDFVESMRRKCELFTDVLPDPWDGKTLPYPDNIFNLVISFSVFLHVPPSDIDRIFSEHVRVTRKYFYIATYAGGLDRTADHCFEHDYELLIMKHGLRILDKTLFKDGLRVNWLLEK